MYGLSWDDLLLVKELSPKRKNKTKANKRTNNQKRSLKWRQTTFKLNFLTNTIWLSLHFEPERKKSNYIALNSETYFPCKANVFNLL